MRILALTAVAIYAMYCAFTSIDQVTSNSYVIMAILFMMQTDIDRIKNILTGSRITQVNYKSRPPHSE